MDETVPGSQGAPMADGGALDDLTEDECLRLLQRAEVGRVAWCTSDGPVVLPVNIRVTGRTVLVRTRPSSEMVAKVDAERVAVQIDHLDRDRREGWSVLARGVAEVRFPGRRTGLPMPWAPGPHAAEVVVTIDQLSGRRLWSGEDHDPAWPGS